MNDEINDEMAALPLGEGGAELGMTRGEIQEHIDWLWEYSLAQTEFAIEMIFAWFIAMTFIARRLTTRQFIVVHFFYLAFLLRQYMAMEDAQIALVVWLERIGLPPVNTDPGFITNFYNQYVAGYADQVLFFAAVAGSVWWSLSCRKAGNPLADEPAPG